MDAKMKRTIFFLLLLLLLDVDAREPQKSPTVRSTSDKKTVLARDLGVPFDGTPGQLNAITDVVGVEVGYATIIRGEGKLVVGKGPVRTGVTAIIPRGHDSLNDPVYTAVFSLNGNGEMTGTNWIEESGFLEGPIVITNTHSVGVARDAVIAWRIKHGAADASGYWWSLPLVAETWDGWLNDTNGFHVKPEDTGSCIAVVATDAPLLPNQLKRLARRVSIGLARTGTISGNGSGDLFIAFSTANKNVWAADQGTHSVQTVPNDLMDPIFNGVVEATEEAVVNALVDNQTMTGAGNHRVEALAHDRLRELLKKYNRLKE